MGTKEERSAGSKYIVRTYIEFSRDKLDIFGLFVRFAEVRSRHGGVDMKINKEGSTGRFCMNSR